MNALVLGGNRFIGAELVAKLLSGGHQVSVIALDPPPPELKDFVRFMPINRNDLDGLRTFFAGKRFDVVFDNIAFRAEQVQGLLEALGGNVGRYVLTGTMDIYPAGVVLRQWREEDGPLDPSTLDDAPLPARQAGLRKSAAERGCAFCHRASRPGDRGARSDPTASEALGKFRGNPFPFAAFALAGARWRAGAPAEGGLPHLSACMGAGRGAGACHRRYASGCRRRGAECYGR
jgi:hypothetical protein